MSTTRGEISDGTVEAFRQASGLTMVMSAERIRNGLAAVAERPTAASDMGVIVALQVVDAAMSALSSADRARVARAFVKKYAGATANPDAPELSPKQWAVLRSLAAGHGTAGTARVLGVGARTVSQHIERMMDKFGARDRTQIVAEAFRRGML